MDLDFIEEKNIHPKQSVEFVGKDEHNSKKARGGYILKNYEMFKGSVIYGKDSRGKKVAPGLFELTNHALVK